MIKKLFLWNYRNQFLAFTPCWGFFYVLRYWSVSYFYRWSHAYFVCICFFTVYLSVGCWKTWGKQKKRTIWGILALVIWVLIWLWLFGYGVLWFVGLKIEISNMCSLFLHFPAMQFVCLSLFWFVKACAVKSTWNRSWDLLMTHLSMF